MCVRLWSLRGNLVQLTHHTTASRWRSLEGRLSACSSLRLQGRFVRVRAESAIGGRPKMLRECAMCQLERKNTQKLKP